MASEPTAPGDVDERFVGRAMERREDHHLITGDARYADDIQYPRATHLALLRSQYGHARIEDVDTSAAEDVDGVVAVYTADDLAADGVENRLPGDEPDFGVAAKRRILAEGKARYQGEPIVAVVAEDRYTASEAVDRIEVSYDRLDAVTDPSEGDGDGPSIHDHAPDNVAFEWEGGDPDATEAAFEDADRVVETDIEINRVMAVPMEPRAAVAQYQAADDHLTLEVSCQNVIAIQDDLAEMLGVPEQRVSVKAPDVGGGFGVKIQEYTGHVMASWASMQVERPVKWTATRTEALQSTHHSRRHSLTARAALDADARMVGLHMESTADVGAYLSQFTSRVSGSNVGTRLLGAYDIPNAAVEITGVFTNTTPMSAYRGAGRPEATYIIERLASACARDIGMDPAEFRRRNFIPPEEFPYETPFGATYDSGDYETAMDKALDIVDYDSLRERQAAAREEGRYLGIGLSSYIEICGGGAGSLQGGRVRMLPSGKVVALSSMVENGQGHKTSFAQIVADELGVDYDDVEVVEGDTDRVPEGGGTGGSKAVAMGGNALKASAENLREKARKIAAHELEAAPEDVAFEDGEFSVAGAPTRSVSMATVAERAYSTDLPPDLRRLEDTTFFSPEGSTAPFGTHVAVVEVDPDTGEVDFERYVAVDDVGTQINPTLLEGQIVGGIAQSVGQALYENAEYDANGTLVSGSLQDYALPRSFDVPEVEWDSTVTPSPNNPLGVKGVGEAGTIGAMPAVVNAVIDAVQPFGVDELDMPLTAEKVWDAMADER
ncbi:MAG: xanthine dehydrogenase family protein molybdopterin-binding subunit [Haloarculaceae archaeon]